MTITTETPADIASHVADVDNALARIGTAVDALRRLAELVQAHPEIARAVVEDLPNRSRPARVLVYVSEYDHSDVGIPERIAALASDAAEVGAAVEQHRGDRFAGVNADFGLVQLHIYSDLDSVGQVSKRTKQVSVTDFQPHPALAAFPKGGSK